MTFRFLLTIESSQTEVHPLNWLSCTLQDALDDDQIYYRRKFNGTLRFYNSAKNGITDFDLLNMVATVDPCTEMILTIEEKNSGANTWHEYWTGVFRTKDGRFDLDNCTFDVTPKPYDDYRNFDNYGDKEYNILRALSGDKVTTRTILPATLYEENLLITDVIEFLLGQLAPGATLVSNFLTSATNPVLGGPNQFRYLTIAQKSDIKRPEADVPANVGKMSFNGIMDILRGMYNLYWTFDGSTLRIEHYDFFSSDEGLDLRTQRSTQRSNRYNYLREDMPKYEKFSFMEAGDPAYTPTTISYGCGTNPQHTATVELPVTTDLSYIQESVSTAGMEKNISDEGWVILASKLEGADLYVEYGVAPGSTVGTYNYVNSWGYLLRAFFMHGRVLIEGTINNSPVDFISTRKIKRQELSAVVCHSDGYTPQDLIKTQLGEDYFSGQLGQVHTANLHPDGRVDFVLLYGQDKNTTPTPFAPYKALHCVVDLPRHVYSHLSEANNQDTYYTVLFDEGLETEECLEILIQAGTTFQDDIADTEHTVVSGINTSDSSLSGWAFVYNDNETWVETADCGTPPDPPEAPPNAPVLNDAQQADQWECVIVGTWNVPLTTTYFELYRSRDGGAYELLTTLPVNYTEYNDCHSSHHDYRGETWCYKVKACNLDGCSDFSNEVCVDVNTA